MLGTAKKNFSIGFVLKSDVREKYSIKNGFIY